MKYIDADKLKKEIEKLKIDFINFHPGTDLKLVKSYLGYCSYENVLSIIDSLQQEQPEMDLEKFTEKMDAWKARYNYPDNFSIKATMAFTARMFYMYPNVAREWYDSLPKVTLD